LFRKCLYTVAKLGVADVLAKGPLTPEAIAKRAGAHPPSLRRVLRALASVGVFAEGVLAQFFLGELVRAAVIVLRQLPHGRHVTALRPCGEPPPLPILQHSST